jgi:chemotaxis protein histidine kinase CheA
MQSTQTLKEADPHDVFAIESVLAAHAHRAPPPVHDSATAPPVAPPVQVAPEISPNIRPSAPPSVSPNISLGAPVPQVDPTFRATDVRDIQVENIRRDGIKVDDLKAVGDLKSLGERPASKWGKRIFMALLGLCGAIAAAAWQHYGDQAKAMAAGWAPPFVLAALSPSDKPPAAEQASTPAVQAAAATDQAGVADQTPAQPATPAQPQPEQAAAPAAAGVAPAATAASAESAQLQSMAQDLAAMGQQVEELKATIAQLKASQAQMAREVAKAAEARTAEVRPSENPRPRAAAAAPPRPAAAPARRPTPAYPQAAYVPPMPPYPSTSAQAQPAPPPQQTMADDGEPVVRPPMPLR